MRRSVLATVLLLGACAGSSEATTTDPPSPVCEEPPLSELDASSSLVMSIEPNPAPARSMVTLMVSSDGVPGDPVVGVDARWQCWAGSEWATTHIIYRGFGDLDGQTIPLNENFQIQVPDIGLALDESYPIVIPQVTEGTYRIADEVFFNGGQVDGFVIVDVTGNG